MRLMESEYKVRF